MSNQATAGVFLYSVAVVAVVAQVSVALIAQSSADGLAKLSEYGLTGILMGVIIAITYLLLRRTLDARESDQAWYRNELEKKRELFADCLREQQVTFQKALDAMITGIGSRLEKLDSNIDLRQSDWIRMFGTIGEIKDVLQELESTISSNQEVMRSAKKQMEDHK